MDSDSTKKDPLQSVSLLRSGMLCAAITLLLYRVLPLLLESNPSSVPSFAWNLLGWPQLSALLEIQSDAASALCLIAFGVILFGVYWIQFQLAGRDSSLNMRRLIFWSGAAFLVMNLFSPVMLSTDIHAYAFYGRLNSFYHLDASEMEIPASLNSDPYLVRFLAGRGYVGSVYGPLWTILSGVLARLGGLNVALVVFLFRGLAAAAILACSWLLGKILERLSPERAAQGMVLFLWNPIVIIESAMSGHNDAVMAFFLVSGIWLHLRGWKMSATLALLFSGMIKFITGPLVPLYLWLVMRERQGWKKRVGFLARNLVGCGLITLGVFAESGMHSILPAARFAGSPDFYMNNFHELVFKGLRLLLGEDRLSIQIPLSFQGWWFSTRRAGIIYDQPDKGKPILEHVEKNKKLLLIAPYTSEWIRVYDPISRCKGYLSKDLIQDTDNDFDLFDFDPEVVQLEMLQMDRSTVVTANLWIHRTCYLLFALVGLIAAWKTTNFDRFLSWSVIVVLATYYLVMTQFWPWYMIWALALGALKPLQLSARLALMLSAGAMTLYVTTGYDLGDHEWIYVWRSIPAVILPTILFLFTLRKYSSEPPIRI